MIIEYTTTCPVCGEDVTAWISVSPEQAGGPETEPLPEHWELDSDLSCGCSYEFERAEEQAVVDAARKELAR
jgi:hypothetical protein